MTELDDEQVTDAEDLNPTYFWAAIFGSGIGVMIILGILWILEHESK